MAGVKTSHRESGTDAEHGKRLAKSNCMECVVRSSDLWECLCMR